MCCWEVRVKYELDSLKEVVAKCGCHYFSLQLNLNVVYKLPFQVNTKGALVIKEDNILYELAI